MEILNYEIAFFFNEYYLDTRIYIKENKKKELYKIIFLDEFWDYTAYACPNINWDEMPWWE